MKTIFITGTTGFMGSYFLYHLLQHSEDNIICLARNTTKFSAKTRVLQQLYKIHESFCNVKIHDVDIEIKIKKRLQILSGDITQKNLGLIKNFAKSAIKEFWHIAANVQFCESVKDEILKVNFEGGKNVLQFVKDNKIAVLNYISTAYVAGQKTGLVNETSDFDLFPANNIYEESKRLIEKEILTANRNGEFNFRIFRPSIIIGHSKTCQPDPSKGGLYGFLTLANSLKKRFETCHPGYFKKNGIRLHANGISSLSMITVDYVADMIFNIANSAASLNKIYHVSSDNNTMLNELSSIINQFTDLKFSFENTTENFQILDYLFAKKIKMFNCYLSNEKQFEKNNMQNLGVATIQYCLKNEILCSLIDRFYAMPKDNVIRNKCISRLFT